MYEALGWKHRNRPQWQVNPEPVGKSSKVSGKIPNLAGKSPKVSGKIPNLAGKSPKVSDKNPNLSGKSLKLAGKSGTDRQVFEKHQNRPRAFLHYLTSFLNLQKWEYRTIYLSILDSYGSYIRYY
ncbi:hypothetical protein COD92_06955 [Bacillus sp. AFS037270]|nr:hypothetical protein COD92_06955 [Bacillus sp. AFS037270]